MGITGYINYNEKNEGSDKIIIDMTEKIIKRGPDGTKYYHSKAFNIHFGNTLLKTKKENYAPQLLVYKNEENHLIINFDGELYNNIELVHSLSKKGYNLNENSSDVEIILASWLEFKYEVFSNLNGVFSISIFDEIKKQLVLVRDHIGNKPLYYCKSKSNGGSFLFTSEIKSLFVDNLIEAQVSLETLKELFINGPIQTPGTTIYVDIYSLKHGCYLEIDSNFNIKETCYWKLKSLPLTDNLEQITYKIDYLLYNSLVKRLKRDNIDEPIVSMLSGGLDSSGLVSMIYHNNYIIDKEFKINTYSVNQDNDENKDHHCTTSDEYWAEKVSKYFSTNHETIDIDCDDLIQDLLEPMRNNDYPTVGEMESSLNPVYRKLKQHSNVVISGEGSDEIFAGYSSYYKKENLLQMDYFPWIKDEWNFHLLLKEEIKKEINVDEFIKTKFNEALNELTIDQDELHGLSGEDKEIKIKEKQLNYLLISNFLPYLLNRCDSNSIGAHAIQVRNPFLDVGLIEYVFNIPYEVKSIDNYEKGLLRRVFSKYLPNDVCYRKKQSYPSIKESKYTTYINDYMLKILDSNSNSPILKFVDKDQILKMIKDEHSQIKFPVTRMLMEFMIQFHHWFKDYNIKLIK
ncbi:hypothetical protein DICPUDRAFT_150759 [Dictyostelium purpureum]|uniref:Glutamine amidotransferase type-2 domain-containing protein n=1 Tax=Dictyostelium purpureum TaxID=5786 RepID=F0ZH66_DICPU|nr:uncharacterized protein DICPUDRAFT_150759 [Dictyostelium purpureum]EGC36742.1 hypothetical protein DICPUDRAFT_150759 [Dictyostelium purpureum]|eukprot:XP_003286767.1 hypothetical protein DICPUDRAFT_150759 [Dictyostelium purpureum]